jgi:hypothetical protein
MHFTKLLAIAFCVVAASLPSAVQGHAVMLDPTPRQGMGNGVGIKLGGTTTFTQDCGGSLGSADPGAGEPSRTYVKGSTVTVSWRTTIAHQRGDPGPGVRWAISPTGTDFGNGVLATGLAAGPGGDHTATITLPSRTGREVLQFNWASESDGGSYVGCADILLVADVIIEPPVDPTAEPTESQTAAPTTEVTQEPSAEPTEETPEPTEEQTAEPSTEPTTKGGKGGPVEPTPYPTPYPTPSVTLPPSPSNPTPTDEVSRLKAALEAEKKRAAELKAKLRTAWKSAKTQKKRVRMFAWKLWKLKAQLKKNGCPSGAASPAVPSQLMRTKRNGALHA